MREGVAPVCMAVSCIVGFLQVVKLRPRFATSMSNEREKGEKSPVNRLCGPIYALRIRIIIFGASDMSTPNGTTSHKSNHEPTRTMETRNANATQHNRTINLHMTVHPPQQPRSFSRSLISILFCGPLPPANPDTPDGYVDISLLYRRISRTMSKKALSTLMRDLAEVSMNLQPNCRATASPSAQQTHLLVSTGHTERELLTQGMVESGRTLLRDLPVGVQIAFVADDDDGEVILVLDAQYLLLKGHDLLERLP